MANYYASARSNYFRVKIPALFELLMGELGINYDVIEDEKGRLHYCLNGDDHSGGFPTFICADGFEFRIKHDNFDGLFFVSKNSARNKDEIETLIGNHLPGATISEIEEVDELEVSLQRFIPPHLPDGVIAVFMEAGAEKLRYIVGYAIAVSPDGRAVGISLNEIYMRAAKKFGIPESEIVPCSYQTCAAS